MACMRAQVCTLSPSGRTVFSWPVGPLWAALIVSAVHGSRRVLGRVCALSGAVSRVVNHYIRPKHHEGGPSSTQALE